MLWMKKVNLFYIELLPRDIPTVPWLFWNVEVPCQCPLLIPKISRECTDVFYGSYWSELAW